MDVTMVVMAIVLTALVVVVMLALLVDGDIHVRVEQHDTLHCSSF
jgi:hypothetical protein